MKRINRLNREYGRLQVVGFYGTVNGRATWVCRCRCGKKLKVSGSHLASGHTTSCGCSRFKLAPGDSVFNAIYAQMSNWYKNGNYEFALSKRYLRFLHKQPCFYCGATLTNHQSKKSHRYGYRFNGIDRIDNNHGYTKKNIVTCCFQCNRAKSNKSTEEFISWIDKVYLTIHKSGKPATR